MTGNNKTQKSQSIAQHQSNKSNTSRDKIFDYDRGKVTTTGSIPPKKK